MPDRVRELGAVGRLEIRAAGRARRRRRRGGRHGRAERRRARRRTRAIAGSRVPRRRDARTRRRCRAVRRRRRAARRWPPSRWFAAAASTSATACRRAAGARRRSGVRFITPPLESGLIAPRTLGRRGGSRPGRSAGPQRQNARRRSDRVCAIGRARWALLSAVRGSRAITAYATQSASARSGSRRARRETCAPRRG